MYNELVRTDTVLIKYMDQVKLYDEDFKILDRYRGYLEIVREYGLVDRPAFILLHQLFKEHELDIFKDNGDYIVNALRKHAMNKYLHKED